MVFDLDICLSMLHCFLFIIVFTVSDPAKVFILNAPEYQKALDQCYSTSGCKHIHCWFMIAVHVLCFKVTLKKKKKFETTFLCPVVLDCSTRKENTVVRITVFFFFFSHGRPFYRGGTWAFIELIKHLFGKQIQADRICQYMYIWWEKFIISSSRSWEKTDKDWVKWKRFFVFSIT